MPFTGSDTVRVAMRTKVPPSRAATAPGTTTGVATNTTLPTLPATLWPASRAGTSSTCTVRGAGTREGVCHVRRHQQAQGVEGADATQGEHVGLVAVTRRASTSGCRGLGPRR